MDTAQLDAILARHRAAESRISANLVEFDQHRAFELLNADDLSGARRASARGAVWISAKSSAGEAEPFAEVRAVPRARLPS